MKRLWTLGLVLTLSGCWYVAGGVGALALIGSQYEPKEDPADAIRRDLAARVGTMTLDDALAMFGPPTQRDSGDNVEVLVWRKDDARSLAVPLRGGGFYVADTSRRIEMRLVFGPDHVLRSFGYDDDL